MLLGDDLGRYDEALVLHRRAVALDPLSPVLKLILAGSLDATGRTKEAEATIARLIADDPEYPQAYMFQGMFAASAGDLIGALRGMREHEARDPEAIGYALTRCFMLLDFAATAEAGHCIAGFARRAPDHPWGLKAQAQLAYIAGDLGATLSFLDRAGDDALESRAEVMLRLGRAAEALGVYRNLAPELLTEPMPALSVVQASRALEVGAALQQTGAQAQGRALIEQALPVLMPRRPGFTFAPFRWRDVLGYALLAEREQAFTALEQRVAHGDFVGLYWLDADPLLADMRADPRFERIVAPARAKAAEQVRLARSAGLL
ncbi:MAG: tetratricopeptide repeat protein [Lysobacterales bacterium]